MERERLLLVRIFCMFDQPFPKSEEAYQAGWPAKGWLPIFSLINTTGTSGSMKLDYSVFEPRNGYIFVETAGTGLISAGAGVDSGGDSLVNASVAGSPAPALNRIVVGNQDKRIHLTSIRAQGGTCPQCFGQHFGLSG